MPGQPLEIAGDRAQHDERLAGEAQHQERRALLRRVGARLVNGSQLRCEVVLDRQARSRDQTAEGCAGPSGARAGSWPAGLPPPQVAESPVSAHRIEQESRPGARQPDDENGLSNGYAPQIRTAAVRALHRRPVPQQLEEDVADQEPTERVVVRRHAQRFHQPIQRFQERVMAKVGAAGAPGRAVQQLIDRQIPSAATVEPRHHSVPKTNRSARREPIRESSGRGAGSGSVDD